MTTTTDILASTTDLTGFPLKPCGRCGGSGHYSFCPKFGTECFGCMRGTGEGTGLAFATKLAGVAASEHATALRRAKVTVAQSLVVGDKVWVRADDDRIGFEKRGAGRWVEVVAVEISDEECGWVTLTDRVRTATTWRTTVTLADGSVHAKGGENIRRFAVVDRTPFVETAWASCPVKVQKGRKIVLAMMGQIR